MALKLRLKTGDRLILGGAYLEVERTTFNTVYVSIEAPQDVAIFKQRPGLALPGGENSDNNNQAQSAEYD